MNLYSMVKVKSQIRNWLIPQELFYWTQFIRNKFGAYPISIPSRSPAKLRIGCVMMFLTSSGTDRDHHGNTSRYGV